MPIFIVFGLTRPGIEPMSTASVADGLSTRPLIADRFLAVHLEEVAVFSCDMTSLGK